MHGQIHGQCADKHTLVQQIDPEHRVAHLREAARAQPWERRGTARCNIAQIDHEGGQAVAIFAALAVLAVKVEVRLIMTAHTVCGSGCTQESVKQEKIKLNKPRLTI